MILKEVPIGRYSRNHTKSIAGCCNECLTQPLRCFQVLVEQRLSKVQNQLGFFTAPDHKFSSPFLFINCRKQFHNSPLQPSVFFFNSQVIDAGKSFCHQSVFIKLPVFVAISAEPLSFLILIFIFKPDSNPVIGVGPILFL